MIEVAFSPHRRKRLVYEYRRSYLTSYFFHLSLSLSLNLQNRSQKSFLFFLLFQIKIQTFFSPRESIYGKHESATYLNISLRFSSNSSKQGNLIAASSSGIKPQLERRTSQSRASKKESLAFPIRSRKQKRKDKIFFSLLTSFSLSLS